MTDEDQILLEEYADKIDIGRYSGQWVLKSTGMVPRTAADTLDLVKSCLALDIPVTDTLTSKAWSKVVFKILELERRLDAQ